MARKNFAATGSFLAEDRGRALDLLGFASQLIFNTFHNSPPARLGALAATWSWRSAPRVPTTGR